MKKTNDIDKYSIYELRNLARSLGVKSATTMKKFELSNTINNILSGELHIDANTTRQGRPPISSKNNFVFANANDIFMNIESEFDKYFDIDNFNILNLNQDIEKFNSHMFEKEGYLEILPDGRGILINNEVDNANIGDIILLSRELVAMNNLIFGDKIIGEVYNIIKDKPKLMVNIKKINDIKIEDYKNEKYITNNKQTNNFEIKTKVFGNNQINDYAPFYFGASMMLKINNYRDGVFLLKNIPNKENNFDNIIYLDISIDEKEIEVINNFDDSVIKFYTKSNANKFDIERCIKLALNSAKRIADFGKNVLILINNFDEIIERDIINNNNYYFLNNIFNLVGKYNLGSISLIITTHNETKNINQLEKRVDISVPILKPFNLSENFFDFKNIEYNISHYIPIDDFVTMERYRDNIK